MAASFLRGASQAPIVYPRAAIRLSDWPFGSSVHSSVTLDGSVGGLRHRKIASSGVGRVRPIGTFAPLPRCPHVPQVVRLDAEAWGRRGDVIRWDRVRQRNINKLR
jgi:hypothetical protein